MRALGAALNTTVVPVVLRGQLATSQGDGMHLVSTVYSFENLNAYHRPLFVIMERSEAGSCPGLFFPSQEVLHVADLLRVCPCPVIPLRLLLVRGTFSAYVLLLQKQECCP